MKRIIQQRLTMKNYILRAAKKLAGVRMLRCAMMLALLVVTATEVRAEDLKYIKLTCLYCKHTSAYREGNYKNISEYQYFIPKLCKGYFYCIACKQINKQDIHDMSGPDLIEPTCTDPGGMGGICKRCGEKKIEKIEKAALGHDYDTVYVEPTCIIDGYYHTTCKRCSSFFNQYPLQHGGPHDPHYSDYRALGHDMAWTTIAATCTTGGYEHGHCQRSGCNYEETRNQTPALGHDFALNHNCTRCDAVDPAKQPEGYIDHCAGGALQFSISGWAYDANVPATSIDIHVYVYQNDGTTRYGDIHIIRADLERPDLATARGIPTNHGYSATIPIADAGTYKVKAYAIDLNGDGNPQIGATQTITVSVPYIAANGQAQNCNSATRLTGGAATTLSGGWYYVKGEVNYTGCLTLDGDANIILCDGATLNIGSSESRLTTSCILGQDYTLTVYGQGQQTGALYGYNKTSNKISAISNRYNNPRTACVSQFTQYGGNVTFDLNVHTSAVTSPYPVEANVDFRGGHFTANGGYGIKGNVNINWSDSDDRFRTSGFGPNGTGGTVTIAGGKAFTDGTNYYAGTLDNTTKVSAQGRTLWPVTAISLSDIANNSTAVTKLNGVTNLDVTLSDRTLYQDGDWNTLCLPFDINDLTGTIFEDATLMTLDTDAGAYEHITGLDNGTLYLNFKDAQSITAGTPYIVKWDNAGTTIEEPEFKGVTLSKTTNNVTSNDGKVKFVGYYDLFNIDTPANDDIYYLTTDNQLMHTGKARTLHPMRAYFQLSDGAGVKAFRLSFGGEITNIGEIPTFRDVDMSKEAWYDLSGRRFTTRPTRRGFYIHQNNKIAIH